MKALVTGSSGFIGWWTCAYLHESGFEVIGLDVCPSDRKDCWYRHVTCDVLHRDRLCAKLGEFRPDFVIHLAARTDLDEKLDLKGYAVNVEGVKNLLDAIQSAGSVRRAVYTSSRLVCRTGHVPSSMEEYCPDTLYGESKVLTEKLVKEADGRVAAWCLVRPTTVWGPRMGWHYKRMLYLIRKGRYFHCGVQKLRKSYSYVRNIAWQYVRLLQVPEEQIHRRTLYLADYEPLSLRDYADELARVMGAPPIKTLPLPLVRPLAKCGDFLNSLGWHRFPFNSFRLRNICTEYIFDLSPTKEICGPLPYEWREGVVQTGQWYLEQCASSAKQQAC